MTSYEEAKRCLEFIENEYNVSELFTYKIWDYMRERKNLNKGDLR